MSLEKLYLSEVRAEINKFSDFRTEVITEKDIASLPWPVRNYFNYCGYIDRKKMMNAKVEWKDVYLKRGFNKDWMKLDCYQFNSAYEPTRIIYMKTKVLGIFPFEARDKYQDGRGNMLIKLLKLFTVGNAKGKETDESALVTVLAEALFIPAYALQDYIKWTAIDLKVAKATLTFKGIEVSGLFYFNEKSEFIRFETNDRYFSTTGKEYEKIKWSATVDHYEEKNGIKLPTVFKATWHTENSDFDYFKGRVANIQFNISN